MNTKFLFNFATKQNYLFEQSKNQKFFFSLLIEINFKTKSYTSKSDVIYHIEAKLIDKLHIFQLSFYITLETSIFLNVRENCKQKLMYTNVQPIPLYVNILAIVIQDQT